MIRSVSAQWGKDGIRANAVAPGLVLSIPGQSIGEEMIEKYIEQCDTTYVGQPEDIAKVVAFLASDDSRYITGQVVRVDGGFTQHSPLVAGSRATGMMAGKTFVRNG